MFHLVLALVALFLYALPIIVAVIVISLFLASLVIGIVLLIVAKKYSKDETKRVPRRILKFFGIASLLISSGCAGIIIYYIFSMMG